MVMCLTFVMSWRRPGFAGSGIGSAGTGTGTGTGRLVGNGEMCRGAHSPTLFGRGASNRSPKDEAAATKSPRTG
ncbi:hypothetical protein HMPREF9440_00627 [Sutterella parvirubra YIT 11816]|uniref:Uncharacterized protein n=1 Tax=Sutterella parvirubra YIT 11816 TaxID=762967 RepID=H3KD20_9BURK|nr:hypothetical protein HMPREF9440_00627 [Sutterella parvirubra YIT 11816]